MILCRKYSYFLSVVDEGLEGHVQRKSLEIRSLSVCHLLLPLGGETMMRVHKGGAMCPSLGVILDTTFFLIPRFHQSPVFPKSPNCPLLFTSTACCSSPLSFGHLPMQAITYNIGFGHLQFRSSQFRSSSYAGLIPAIAFWRLSLLPLLFIFCIWAECLTCRSHPLTPLPGLHMVVEIRRKSLV